MAQIFQPASNTVVPAAIAGALVAVVFALAAYFWLALLIIGTLHDYLTRN